MNIYMIEIKRQWKPLVLWSLGIFFYLLSAWSKFQGYSRSGQSIEELLKDLPSGFSSFLGANLVDLQSAGGFFSVTLLYLSVMLAVHAVLLGSGIIAREETDKTIEFLVSKPVSRNRILFSKLLAALTGATVLNLVTMIFSMITASLFNDGPTINGEVVFLMPAVFLIQLVFLMVGVLFATVLRNPKRASTYSAAVMLAAFILSAFVDISNRFQYLRYLTPFQYFDAKVIYSEDAYDWVYIAITIVAVIVMLTLSRFSYRSRDFSV